MTLRLNIRGRLMLLVAVTLLPAAGVLAYRVVEDRRRAARNALDLARTAAAEQRRVVDGARQLLAGVALAPVLSSGDGGAIEAFLVKLRGQHGRYSDFLFAGADGRVAASALPLRVDVDLSERPYFTRVVRTGAFAFSNYELGRVSLRPQIELGQPMFDAKGELSDVLIAAIDLAWLQQSVGTLRAACPASAQRRHICWLPTCRTQHGRPGEAARARGPAPVKRATWGNTTEARALWRGRS
jgi:hypothetical protein